MTKNFKISEFQSKCGTPMPPEVQRNIQRLCNNLQVLRDELGLPITISSGYRSPEHNKRIGGAVKSTHILGLAADFKVKGMKPADVAVVIERLIKEGKMEQGGLKAYATWIHYDCRGSRARW
jgi:uncharacterized protein YcbK (DUF882 family)